MYSSQFDDIPKYSVVYVGEVEIDLEKLKSTYLMLEGVSDEYQSLVDFDVPLRRRFSLRRKGESVVRIGLKFLYTAE